MNLQQLEYFKTAAEFENYTMAAEILSITQPALSKAISNLEKELNVMLFEKDGRRIRLTKFGSLFLKHVNLALLEINNGIDELKRLTNSKTGVIKIASTYSIGNYFISLVINKFLQKNPDSKFEFYTTSRSSVFKDLKDGKIDLGFYEGFNGIENFSLLESIPIKKERYVLIVSKNNILSTKNEISLKDLKNETFIISYECDKNKIKSLFKLAGFSPNISIRAGQATLLNGLVESGAGISIVPNTPNIDTSRLAVLNITENIGERTIYMGTLKDSYLSPIVTNFKEEIISF